MLRSTVLAVVLLTPALTGAQDETTGDAVDVTPSLTWVLERARALDGQADYVPAAELYEVYAEACIDTATAVLERGSPCDETDGALARAFELRRALGDVRRAAHDAELYGTHFLYAQPRRALQVRYQMVRMHLEGGDLDAAEETLDTIDATGSSPSPRQEIISHGLRALIATGRGQTDRATRAWRRVERLWRRDADAIAAGGPIPLDWVREGVAEARLTRAETFVARYFASPRPQLRGVRTDSRWWAVVSRWLLRSRRRLALARVALERVYELGSVRHSVIAAARIGELYVHVEQVHSSLRIPDNPVLRALVGEGIPRPGYDEARSHFETCVAWASYHNVAPDWGERCEERLHALDPYAYPMRAELHGDATYHPVSRALPHLALEP